MCNPETICEGVMYRSQTVIYRSQTANIQEPDSNIQEPDSNIQEPDSQYTGARQPIYRSQTANIQEPDSQYTGARQPIYRSQTANIQEPDSQYTGARNNENHVLGLEDLCEARGSEISPDQYWLYYLGLSLLPPHGAKYWLQSKEGLTL